MTIWMVMTTKLMTPLTEVIQSFQNPHDIRGGFGLKPPRAWYDQWPWWLYNGAWFLGFWAFAPVVLLVAVLWQPFRRKICSGWRDKIAFYGAQRRERWQQPSQQPRIWVHAVSVGEVHALRPLLRLLVPHYEVWISTTTATGQAQAERLTHELCGENRAFYAPYDAWPCVSQAMRQLRPQAVIVVETELWPNILLQACQQGIPAVLVNGRLSQRSFCGYRWLAWLMKPVLECFSAVLAQSLPDAERFLALGASNPIVMGQLKWDYAPSVNQPLLNELAACLGVHQQEPLPHKPWVVLASTRGAQAGGLDEESLLLPVMARLKQSVPRLRCLLAVRHPERAEKVAYWVEQAGLTVARRSQWLGHEPFDADVVILDTIGELTTAYRLMSIAVMGGSFIPHGGQNPLEPLAVGVPTILGPCMSNFEMIEAELLAAEACAKVASPQELEVLLEDWLKNPRAALDKAAKAQEVLDRHQGASQRAVAVIQALLA
ncbi:MAG: glycosyltransferase N-terminal domain-containing protein [Vampirovibrionales bacterium]